MSRLENAVTRVCAGPLGFEQAKRDGSPTASLEKQKPFVSFASFCSNSSLSLSLSLCPFVKCRRSSSYRVLSHLVCWTFSLGCETRRCQITAWNASECGVTFWGFTVGTMQHASATLAVYPPSRPTIPRID